MVKDEEEEQTLAEAARPVEGEDFYLEGAFVVFTARYHLRRGYCCDSSCRHCPYRATANDTTGKKDEDVERNVD